MRALAIPGQNFPQPDLSSTSRLRKCHELACHLQQHNTYIHEACEAMHRVQQSWQKLAEAYTAFYTELNGNLPTS